MSHVSLPPPPVRDPHVSCLTFPGLTFSMSHVFHVLLCPCVTLSMFHFQVRHDGETWKRDMKVRHAIVRHKTET